MLGSTARVPFKLYLPPGDDNTSSLFVTVQVRDTLNCVAEFNLSKVFVTPDREAIKEFIDRITRDTDTPTNELLDSNSLFRLLNDSNPAATARIVTTISETVNKISNNDVKSILHSKQHNFA